MLHFIRQRTRFCCSVAATVMPNMPMHSYSLAPRNNFVIRQLADRSPWTKFRTRNMDLKWNPSECHGARIYVPSPHSNCDFWPIVNEWRVAFITAKHSGNLGTCGADWRDGIMWCYMSRVVRFVFFSSLSSILKFATYWCDSTNTSQSFFTTNYYTHSSVPARGKYYLTFSFKANITPAAANYIKNCFKQETHISVIGPSGSHRLYTERSAKNLWKSRHLEQRKSYRPQVHQTLLPSCASCNPGRPLPSAVNCKPNRPQC
jgi:hypothetical protein